ncbi:MAG: YceI family protein [Saprospiraceae bacterium]
MKSLFNFTLLIAMLSFVACKEKAPKSDENLAVAAEATGKTYAASPEMSKISWEGSKPTGKHNGSIKVSEGSLSVNEGKLVAGSFVIDMKSIVVEDLTGDEKASLEAHLMGTQEQGAADFFNTSKFPTAKFDITKVEPSTDAAANSLVTGNLTMLDITKEVKIPANITVSEAGVNVVSAPFTINRTDWGINFKSQNFFKDLGDKFIDDNITLSVQLDAK